MQINYIVMVFIITYICGAITKTFVDEIPNKYIPLQNVFIGVVSGLLCCFAGIEENLLQALILCFMSAIGAGGTADLKKIVKGDEK